MNESETVPHDPVCGALVEKATALYDEHDGEMFYFCNYFCRHEFLAAHLAAGLPEKG